MIQPELKYSRFSGDFRIFWHRSYCPMTVETLTPCKIPQKILKNKLYLKKRKFGCLEGPEMKEFNKLPQPLSIIYQHSLANPKCNLALFIVWHNININRLNTNVNWKIMNFSLCFLASNIHFQENEARNKRKLQSNQSPRPSPHPTIPQWKSQTQPAHHSFI